jgi:hypothetical protein
MKRLILIIILFIFFNAKDSDAQYRLKQKCSIRFLSVQTEHKVRHYLSLHKKLLKLRFRFEDSYKRDSIFKEWKADLAETVDTSDIDVIQTVDSVILRLDNGLSWNLNTEPPERPSGFIFKLILKKRLSDQDVIDRIKFLEFCSQFDDSIDNPCQISEKYLVYITITYDNNDIFRVKYELDFSEESGLKTRCHNINLISNPL